MVMLESIKLKKLRRKEEKMMKVMTNYFILVCSFILFFFCMCMSFLIFVFKIYIIKCVCLYGKFLFCMVLVGINFIYYSLVKY